ncbi:hypothetical protein OH76DRAFT_1485475 [Lentinus brumalis]|uniref:Uncharacterized protein n=1 Tax=Lentinus brumalis TaxID=2498619 RepID=A0A371D1H3_9APHY|nr:hypothetical protein OH76DRAFT_1485475 [Polyporus brumalis]
MDDEMTYIEQAQLKRRLRACYRLKIDDFVVMPFIKWVDPANPQNLVPIPDNLPVLTSSFD